jgi:hypothetical protein
MAEGINMGRKSPWTKDEYQSLFKQISNYAMRLSLQLLREEGSASASEAIAAYNIYKCPVVYLFVHYHFGMFDDLEMNEEETTAYLLMFLPNVKYFATELKKAFASGQVFPMNGSGDMDAIMADMCDEIIYIEENF